MSMTGSARVKKHTIKVISPANGKNVLSESELEMDKRATSAVKAAVEKAIICKHPVARFDTVQKKAYIEYGSGERKYVE